jgi:hypothetical protein
MAKNKPLDTNQLCAQACVDASTSKKATLHHHYHHHHHNPGLHKYKVITTYQAE